MPETTRIPSPYGYYVVIVNSRTRSQLRELSHEWRGRASDAAVVEAKGVLTVRYFQSNTKAIVERLPDERAPSGITVDRGPISNSRLRGLVADGTYPRSS